ncbi:nucleotidyl transferase AbiEii/AbiGii toxin family protein [Streptomyces sp. enrichment culture]|uniref:nucleotidyl transferase AbiEii/AbiGii toxin family protein n=1 Tax=Streptomyces sp. enrichment culture TaxID=1795815 RepID=UPI003F5507F6
MTDRDAMRDERRTAHRAVLDHVLALVADAPWSDSLVLRGSMTLPAWVGDAARDPVDLDWVVLEDVVLVDPLDPYPYVDAIEVVQQWPEAADGAARYELWREEEFGSDGSRPLLPPEGLHWVRADAELSDQGPPYADLLERIRSRPQAAPGILLDADAARTDGTWTYVEYDTPGVRLVVPWRADGLPPGEVRLDFARDELLPKPPVWTAVPRGDGGAPVVVRTAGPEVSLAWKVLWLHTDSATPQGAQGKDLYDAVLLAEAAGTRLSARLLRKVLRRALGDAADGFGPDDVTGWRVDWHGFRAEHPWVSGTAQHWLGRLHHALGDVFARDAADRSSVGAGSSCGGSPRRISG